MEELTYVERENGKLYCFIEVCKHNFPNVPKSTVKLVQITGNSVPDLHN